MLSLLFPSLLSNQTWLNVELLIVINNVVGYETKSVTNQYTKTRLPPYCYIFHMQHHQVFTMFIELHVIKIDKLHYWYTKTWTQFMFGSNFLNKINLLHHDTISLITLFTHNLKFWTFGAYCLTYHSLIFQSSRVQTFITQFGWYSKNLVGIHPSLNLSTGLQPTCKKY